MVATAAMAIRPRLLPVLLAVALVLTAQAAAVARGQPEPVGEMVICTTGGLITVAVDAEGNPVGPAHVCPEATAGLVAPLQTAHGVTPGATVIMDTDVFAARPAPRGHGLRPATARDPPAFP